jgi:hypothetical protein
LATFSYVVVLMLENRSFDNLLGNLYAPGELPSGTSFEGVIGKNLSNPIPAGVPAPDLATSVPVLNATDYHDPYPNPGEEYAHVNTQLYNVVSPPFNVPDPLPATAPMTGFVTDYVLNYPPSLGNPPSYDQYSVIMACFPRNSVTILSSLARQFCGVRPLVLLGAEPDVVQPGLLARRHVLGPRHQRRRGTTRAASNGWRTATGRRCSTLSPTRRSPGASTRAISSR